MTRPDGWSDSELFALLQLLRANMTDYIYSTDEAFARSIAHGFRGRTAREIMEVVRDLMDGLSFAMKTRKFMNEAIIVDEGCIYPYEHLYETIAAQPENRQGGVWDADELRNALRKMETYRHFFDVNPELFFARAQIWSKNVPDVRAKFYLWREIYIEEKKKESEILRSDAELKRLGWLAKIFEDVPPAPSPLPTTPSPVTTVGTSPGTVHVTPKKSKSSFAKPPKVRMWTYEELEAFVSLLVEVTLEMQNHGVSSLVKEMRLKLHRTELSMIGKAQDIRLRFENRSSYRRATKIPSVIYDENSVAHKIFTSDWTDRDDPYALGIFALKDFHNRSASVRKSRNRHLPPPPLQMAMRQRASKDSPAPSTRSKTNASPQQPTPGISTEAESPNRDECAYSEFVRDCAAMIKWEEERTLELCHTMRKSLQVYVDGPRSVFFKEVAAAMGFQGEPQSICFRGQRILRLCEQRYGSLACFPAAIEGSDVSTHDTTALSKESSISPTGDFLDEKDSTVPPPANDVNGPSFVKTPQVTKPSVMTSLRGATEQPKLTGKSQELGKNILLQKERGDNGIRYDHSESSPSNHHYSPDHYDLDDDGGIDVEEEVHEELDGDETIEDPGADGDDVDDETQSIASSGSVSSDYSANDQVHHHRNRRYHHYHGYGAPRKVHVSSQKTVVMKHTPEDCYCVDCGRDRRRERGYSSEATFTAVHHKRSRSEMYAQNGRWVEDHHAIHHFAQNHVLSRSNEVFYRNYKDEAKGEVEERALTEIDSMWATLMGPIEEGIAELERKRKDQEERRIDRERRESETHWRRDLWKQVRSELRDVTDSVPSPLETHASTDNGLSS